MLQRSPSDFLTRKRRAARGVLLAALLVSTLVCAVAQPAATGPAPAEQKEWRFDFGPGPVEPGWTGVAVDASYSPERGYGFEPGLAPGAMAEGAHGAGALRCDNLSGATPFLFSVRVPEGNYRVIVTYGDASAATALTVKAESRRLMVDHATTAAGEWGERTFLVNIRTPAVPPPPPNAPGSDHVELNPREQGVLHWDDRLTLEFLDSAPHVCGVQIVRDDTVPTLFIVGDSTVTDQPGEPAASWGQMLTRWFAPTVAVANHAESGETLKSFITELRLDKVLSQVRPGDWLFIQFGHNDEKKQWPQTYVEPFTTYSAYLRVYIAEARRRGVTPVLLTSPQRRTFDKAGHITNSHGDYIEAVKRVGREEGVPVIDLGSISAALYEALGPERAPLAFNAGGKDATHNDNYGAYELAHAIAVAIRAQKLDIAKYLSPDVGDFDPAHPDDPETFVFPASVARLTAAPRGN